MRTHYRSIALLLVTALLATPEAGSAQGTSPASVAPYVGVYTLGDGTVTMPLRVFIADGALMGQLRTNEPTTLRPGVSHSFTPVDAPDVVVRFMMQGNIAVSVSVDGEGMHMTGPRVTDPVSAPRESSTSGPIFDALQRADSMLFDASFAHCDYAKAAAFLAPDVEFYHDQTGFHAGDVVRDDFRRLTANCPAKQGIRRAVVPGSLHVYPIKEFGAVQIGEHTFRETGSATFTTARFVHLWQQRGDRWVLSRVMSFDHLPTPVR